MSTREVKAARPAPLRRLMRELRLYLATEAFGLGQRLGGRYLLPEALKALLALYAALPRH